MSSSWMRAPGRALDRWRALNLVRQFLLVTSGILLCGMIIIGSWIADKIESGVVNNTAAATALFLDNFVEPHVREIATTGAISEAGQAALERLMLPHVLGNRIVSFNVWDMTGRAVFSSRPGVVGTIVTDDDKLIRAMAGKITGAFAPRGYEHVPSVDATARPLLEIYSPIRGANGSVIAVAEFYENGDALQRELQDATRQAWLLVSCVALAMLALQYNVVRRGNAIIERQQLNLNQRIADLSSLLAQNIDLRRRVDNARRASHELNERFMRRLGAELHDGPAQLIGMSILMLGPRSSDTGDANEDSPRQAGPQDVALARDTLVDALEEIRQISIGLFLPDLEKLTLERALTMAAQAHSRRTHSNVATELIGLADPVPHLQKATIYRIAQEGLNNAYFHADGKGQFLRARRLGDEIEIEVLDQGPGPAAQRHEELDDRLGLIGLKDRVASMGGTLELAARTEGGSRLFARIPVAYMEGDHA